MQNFTYNKTHFFCFVILLFFITLETKAQFPFSESFKNSTASNIQFGGSPTSFLTGGAGLKDSYNDTEGNGFLRLTNNKAEQRGMVWSDLYAFPSVYGMTISFEYYAHGGTGADGIAFVLFDATVSPVVPGAFGGSLGYAQNNTTSGFSGGYLGIGIDEFGNFASNNESKTGGTSIGVSNSIVLRGQGSGKTGYPYLTSIQTTASPYLFSLPGKDRTATDNSKPGFRKIEIVLKPREGGGFFIDVYLEHGNTKSLLINNYEYKTVPPPMVKFAITSSTGGDNNFHEIRNLNLSVDLPTLYTPIARPNSLSECAGLVATTLNDINSNNDGTVNTLATINRESIDLDLDTPGIQSSKTVAGKGAFTYDSVTGKVTFTPLNNSVGESVQISYTFNDYYGKQSNVSTITYTPIVNRPIDIVTSKTICSGDTYIWPANGKVYNSTGTYLEINDGCTANQTLELNIGTKPTTVITKENICFGESFTWAVDGKTYTASGTYTKTNDGCTADQELKLTVGTKPATITTTKNICFGESFLWSVDGQTYTTSGTYTQNNNGCTADQVLKLTVGTKPATVTTTKNICFGESFLWSVDGQTYTISGTYTKTNDGCTADQTLELNIGTKPTTVITKKDICFGESLLWDVDGQTYTTSGTYTKTNDGCTADQTLELNIGTKPTTVITKKDICFGEYFTWDVDGQTYTTSGIYTKTNDGCTADQTLELNIGTKPATVITKKDICFGESFLWDVDGKTYSTSGIYTKTNDGCTADQSLELNIGTKPATIITKENICFGESFVWDIDGKTYSTSGTYTKTNDGCTADQTLELNIGTKPATIITKENICFGESFVWDVDGKTYSASGTYTKTNDGCTADQTLELNIATKPATVITKENICFGESFVWDVDGQTYSVSGIYTKTNDGCTADQTLELNIGTKPAKVITKKDICFGESFVWDVDGQTYSTSGIYTKTNDGCTADQTLELNIGTKPAKVITKKDICFGESFVWDVDGQTYSTSGIYTKTNDGCTADQTLELNIGTKPATVITKKDICFGESFVWDVDGQTYSTSGIYTKTNDGCTADQTLELNIGTKPATVITKENICFGKSFVWDVDGKTYSASGIYTKTNDGCTADQTLELNIATKPATIITKENICFGESFVWDVDGKTYSASGTYTQINDGCTADQILELNIGTKPTTVITKENICFGESFTWAVDGQTYSASGVYTKTNDGCTADQTLELNIGTKPAKVITKKDICFGESFVWDVDGKTYSASGTYTKTNDGCTADQTLELNIGTKPAKVITKKDICFGESFVWDVDGQTYSDSGVYTKTNDGCTADQTLELNIGTKPTTVITTKNICFGESFVWSVDGQTYSASGIYTKTNDGCTADQTLELNIGTKPATVITKKDICFGESFVWDIDGQTYSASGIYTKTNDGCTADQTLELNIGTKPTTIITKENICFGESFVWSVDGQTYSASGTYTKTNDGCTADQTLELNIGTKPATVITKKDICFGESFVWDVDGKTYSASGIYAKTNDGCTADQTLELNITQTLKASLVSNSIIPEFCSGDNNASFEIEITGGVMPYSINLDNKNGSYIEIMDNEYTFINLVGGSHTVYIKDAIDCTTEIEVFIPKGITINPFANVSYSCLNDLPSNSVTIKVDPSITHLDDLDYSLDGIIYQSDNTFLNVAAGTHTIKARHTNGCIQSTKEFVIDNIEPLTLTLADGELNEIVATSTGGSGQYRYSFNNESFSTTNKLIIYKSGIYTFTVIDQNGCSATSSKYFEYVDVCISNYFTPNGDGVNDEWGPDCTVNYKNLTYTIFDRYGRTIATYKLGQKWDGKYNGAELTSGDYWYVLKLNDPKDNREFVGHFTLYR